MKILKLNDVVDYISAQIGPQFHDKKISKIRDLRLDDILKRKNPYMFKAKGIISAPDFIKSVLDATLSSGEESTFGNFLENVAIFVCEKVYDGRKSGITGIDLEYEEGANKYLISIKSGPNWANSDQKKHLISNFNSAKKTLSTSAGSHGKNIICVEACCYGTDNNPNKGTHLRLCGQRFWNLISGNNELYRDIIEPLGHLAKERNEAIDLVCSEKLNIFTADFVIKFCDNGKINWDRLIQYNSGSNE